MNCLCNVIRVIKCGDDGDGDMGKHSIATLRK